MRETQTRAPNPTLGNQNHRYTATDAFCTSETCLGIRGEDRLTPCPPNVTKQIVGIEKTQRKGGKAPPPRKGNLLTPPKNLHTYENDIL